MNRNKLFLILSLSVLVTVVFFNFKGKNDTAQTSLNRKPAPNFTLDHMEGGKKSLSDYKGKVVYMDVWATWCMPCIEAMNQSKPLKEAFADNKDVVFLYVSIDENEDKWRKFVKNKNVKGEHLISREGLEEKILDLYSIPFIPRFVLIDKEGNVVQFEAKAPNDKTLIDDIKALL
jgi:thiol-disulfide isomerase/thioredoxin